MLKFRVTAPGKPAAVIEVPAQAAFGELQRIIQEKTGIPPGRQDIRAGFPPTLLSAKPEDPLSSLPLISGVTLAVKEGAAPSTASEAKASSEAKAASGISGSSGRITAIRRIIDDDNSCLFNAVGYVLDNRNRNAQEVLRQVVASVILSDPVTYNAAFLGGKTAEEYAEYIQKPLSWGGGIELAILSDYFEAEIAAVAVETATMQVFGQGKGWQKRAYVIYTGIHYDAVAFNTPDGPESKDITVFPPDYQDVAAAVLQLAKQLQAKGEYTNVNKFTLRCENCGKGLVGQKEAVAHFKETGHSNFAEYR